jgi:sugar lactone lactonase YvrE
MNIHCIFDEPAILGESALWHAEEQALYWVDILKPALHRLDMLTNQHQMWIMPLEISCIGLHSKNSLIAGLRTGFALITLPKGELSWITQPLNASERQEVMFNDGKCDRQGRFWAGTKDLLEKSPIAALYRLTSDGLCEKMADKFTVQNGPAWSPDNTTLYVCDSPLRVIYQYRFDSILGTISDRSIFATIPDHAGYPDGITVDSEGYVWNAHWDGWQVTRYAPNGKIDRVINLPVQRPTSCCFGGQDMTTLYITSARVHLSQEELKRGPKAGCVFAVETEIKGLQEPAFIFNQSSF